MSTKKANERDQDAIKPGDVLLRGRVMLVFLEHPRSSDTCDFDDWEIPSHDWEWKTVAMRFENGHHRGHRYLTATRSGWTELGWTLIEGEP